MSYKISLESKPQAIARLRELLKDGDTVYCVLRDKARSGMSRKIGLMTIRPDPSHPSGVDIRTITVLAANVLNWSADMDRDGVIVRGAGMDMGFHTVYELSKVLGLKLKHQWI